MPSDTEQHHKTLQFYSLVKLTIFKGELYSGGERGIRTLGTLLTYTRFPSVRLKPLGHLSNAREVIAKFSEQARPKAEKINFLSQPTSGLRALWIKRAMASGFLIPGALSTPDDTSTAGAPVIATAWLTFSGFKPPANIHA